MPSPQAEEYLEAIARLEERGQPVTTSALAKECQVSAPTATEMLRRLTDLGLITREPRREAILTDEGRKIASTVLRRHRLWERFLHDVLGLRWDALHEQACELEHATSPELEQWLAETVSASPTCPHGHAIPGVAAVTETGALAPLSTLQAGQTARVHSITREESKLLQQLDSLGLRPGAIVRRSGSVRSDGDLSLTIGGKSAHIAQQIADRVLVRLISDNEVATRVVENIPLSALAPNQVGTIQGYSGGRGIMGRCLALGFTPGAEVKMIRNGGQGPIIVLVRDTRVALGRGQASRIWVCRGELDGATSE